jgi:hypothetical protein
LGNNNLANLPKEIGVLTNLTKLDLDSNQLSNLPKEIGALTNLTSLDLRKNNLANLPKETGGLKNLKTLYLMNNQLDVLPKEMAELKNLKGPELSLKAETNIINKNQSIQKVSLSIGSNYEGGIILSIDNDGQQGLIVARSDQYDGPTGWDNAKNLCDSYVSDGFNKWRLPTIDELKMIYKNRDLIGGLNTRGLYWSSSRDVNGYASLINFGNGSTDYKFNTTMGHAFYVRAVRDFNR